MKYDTINENNEIITICRNGNAIKCIFSKNENSKTVEDVLDNLTVSYEERISVAI